MPERWKKNSKELFFSTCHFLEGAGELFFRLIYRTSNDTITVFCQIIVFVLSHKELAEASDEVGVGGQIQCHSVCISILKKTEKSLRLNKSFSFESICSKSYCFQKDRIWTSTIFWRCWMLVVKKKSLDQLWVAECTYTYYFQYKDTGNFRTYSV